MKIKFKKMHPDAILPTYATDGAAGADVYARLDDTVFVHPGEVVMVPLGFAMSLCQTQIRSASVRLAAFLLPRSGLGHKSGIVLGNLVGLIDEDFRGEVKASVWNRNHDGFAVPIRPGDRIAQMVVQEVIQFQAVEVGSLDDTDRPAGGFGSTGV
jgi:dUTP pyrophosphatase